MSKRTAVKSNKVEEILMRRDGLSKAEAHALRIECADALEAGDYEAIADYLGLEDDYLGYVNFSVFTEFCKIILTGKEVVKI